jgi:hypothetical protein
MCTRSMNLGCFCVVFFDVLIFSPFVRIPYSTGFFVWHVVKDAYLLAQSSCHGISSSLMKKETGGMSPPGLHWRVNA